jgi:segregation and condensation protein B
MSTKAEDMGGAVGETMDGSVVDGTSDSGRADGAHDGTGDDGPADELQSGPSRHVEPDEREIDLDHLGDAAFGAARRGDAPVEGAPTEGGTAEDSPAVDAVGDGPVAGPSGYPEQRRAIEAVLMVAESPVEPTMLAQLLELSPATVDQICDDLARSYRDEQRGFELARVAGGYRFQSHPEMAPYIERFVLEGQSARLSAAALESLAIVAYKQPISRAQVAAIRGVNSDGVLRTLCIRGYVTDVARDPGPGQALLYGTTTLLLERLGLDKIEDLPPLADFVPGPEVMDALEQGLRP